MKPLLKLNSVLFLFSARKPWYPRYPVQNGGTWCPCYSWAACIAMLPLWTLCKESDHISSTLLLKTINSTPLVCHTHSSTWGSWAVVTSSHVITVSCWSVVFVSLIAVFAVMNEMQVLIYYKSNFICKSPIFTSIYIWYGWLRRSNLFEGPFLYISLCHMTIT